LRFGCRLKGREKEEKRVSTDTTTLILKMDGFYYVDTVQAAENITVDRDEECVNYHMDTATKNSRVTTSIDEALIFASDCEDDHIQQIGSRSEYGIVVYIWNGDISKEENEALNRNGVISAESFNQIRKNERIEMEKEIENAIRRIRGGKKIDRALCE
jgi:hypothetical protein